MWLGLHRMNKIGKLGCILNKEYGDIISYNIPVPFLCVEFNCEAADIANGILNKIVGPNGKLDIIKEMD